MNAAVECAVSARPLSDAAPPNNVAFERRVLGGKPHSQPSVIGRAGATVPCAFLWFSEVQSGELGTLSSPVFTHRNTHHDF